MSFSGALTSFSIENNIEQVASSSSLYKYDTAEQKQILREMPWKSHPTYFKSVKISAIALLKMAIHARMGGSIEVMGVMTGKILGTSFVVLDAFALPVEGSETRVNALGEAYEFMVENLQALQGVGRLENVVGWYHSHPGYGCWLSGIDVGTQAQNQRFQDPFLAIVIDPDRTIAAGRIDIGAFRTFPEGTSRAEANTRSDGFSVPTAKVEDFGVHADKYYSLDISYFKSELDDKLVNLLWSQYWSTTLAHSPLVINRQFVNNQIEDLSLKINRARLSTSKSGERIEYDENDENKQVIKDAIRICGEELYGLLARNMRKELTVLK